MASVGYIVTRDETVNHISQCKKTGTKGMQLGRLVGLYGISTQILSIYMNIFNQRFQNEYLGR